MVEENGYQHLETRTGSNYRQLFVKGRKIRAVVIASQTAGEEARTPEEVARDFNIPLQAVLEAIDYCHRHADVVRQDAEREETNIRRLGLDQPPLAPADSSPMP